MTTTPSSRPARRARSAGAPATDQLPFWQRLTQHPAYDSYWQQQAVDRILAGRPLIVPTLYVHGQWDQEDIYGAAGRLRCHRAERCRERSQLLRHRTLAPRRQQRRWQLARGTAVRSGHGPVVPQDGTATLPGSIPERRRAAREHPAGAGIRDRLKHLAPLRLLATELRVRCAAATEAAVPVPLAADCPSCRLRGPDQSYDEYVSDPARPVPYRLRPIRPVYWSDSTWRNWLVDDQRNLSDRTDVLVYTTPVLTAPVRIAGQPQVHLHASTSGTDADWVVKLIDVYPDEVPHQPALGGYQLMVAADIFRGRYRYEPGTSRADRGRQGPRVSICPAQCQSRVPARSSDHG